MTTTTTPNKSTAIRFVEEVLGQGKLGVIDELAVAGYLDHDLPSGVTPQASIAGFRAGFPDAAFAVDDVIEEGDRVVVRYHVTGTHTGSLHGIPPTGKRVAISGISIYRMQAGRLAEAWVQYDQLGLMRQIGVAG